jgi:pyocin large subunit-like protein
MISGKLQLSNVELKQWNFRYGLQTPVQASGSSFEPKLQTVSLAGSRPTAPERQKTSVQLQPLSLAASSAEETVLSACMGLSKRQDKRAFRNTAAVATSKLHLPRSCYISRPSYPSWQFNVVNNIYLEEIRKRLKPTRQNPGQESNSGRA